MTKKEIIERGFTTDKDGRVIDDIGNEYRNEEGMVEFLENELCDNTDCSGKPKDIKPVKMRKEFEGGWFYWCEKCREKNKDMIIDTK